MDKTRKKQILLYIFVPLTMVIVFLLGTILINNLKDGRGSNSRTDFVTTLDSVYGNVYDENLIPIEGVVLKLIDYDNKDFQATTNEEGTYTFTNVPVATYTLAVWTVPSDNYLTVSRTVDLYFVTENTYKVPDIILQKSNNGGIWGPLT